ncbi:rCG59261 [Rattus norvegicus]|uniref:RCG59261 n=1 Tax=Rattus norvegicus TaxID=10116 RepID=A6K7V4_RAT|nr:rCG59261 [Rattus norvegicus]
MSPLGDMKQVDPTPAFPAKCLESFCTLDMKSDTVRIDWPTGRMEKKSFLIALVGQW